jgi:serine/threonine protein kinase
MKVIEADDLEDILKEIQILKECHNESIVGYYGTFKENENEYWVWM